MSWKKHVYELTILEHHLDSFGHVNNATYLEIFEEARWDLITQNGYGYKKVHELKIGPTILEIQLSFKKEVLLRQKIRIESQISSYESRIGELIQEMKSETGEIHCRALFKIALFDMRLRKLIRPTPEWIAAIGGSEALEAPGL